ncbi:MAG: cadherin-like domain-containing protein [Rubricoccaceae bacterium]|nr:cadherin-like domain-containing protein [Rubricoccaceae bacterium]
MRPLSLRAALAFVCLGGVASAQPTLLPPASPPPAAQRLAPEQGQATRARYVRLHPDVQAGRSAPWTVTLDLFDGQRVSLRLRPVPGGADGRLRWRGHVEGRPSEPATLAVADGVAAGRFVVDGEVYLLAYAGGGRHVLYAYEGEPDTCDLVLDEAEGAAAERGPVGGVPGRAGEPLDLLVLYSPAVTRTVGEEGLPPLLDVLLDDLNASFATAGTDHRARLVAAREVAYDEDPERTLRVDLTRLYHPADGHLDEAHAWRDEVLADAVVLLLEEGADACGTAFFMYDFDRKYGRQAFAVVQRGCAHAYLTFAHEIGHLLGIRHDRYVDSFETPAPYAHGFVNAAPDVLGPFRTLMAYDDACRDGGFACPRVASFSSTRARFLGEDLGEAHFSDAARVMDQSVPIVAGYRDPSDPPPMPGPVEFGGYEDEPLVIPLADLLERQLDESVDVLAVDSLAQGSAYVTAEEIYFEPPDDFHGRVPIDYRIADAVGQLGEGTLTVVVSPVNDPPDLPRFDSPTVALAVGEPGAPPLTVRWHPVEDVDGDALGCTWRLAISLDATYWETPLLEREADCEEGALEVPMDTLRDVLASLRVDPGETRMLQQRFTVSDGVYERSTTVHIALTNASPVADPAVAFALEGPFPNPARDLVRLRLDLPDEASVELSLYDLLGRQVGRFDTVVPPGRSQAADFGLGGLAAGLYVYRLRVSVGADVRGAAGRLSVLPR